jgi:AAA domain/UvrD-like helicase C-terminal domain
MHPDLPEEQAYFDRALALRDRQQADRERAPAMAANPRAAVELRKRVSSLGLVDPDEAVAFGRIEAAGHRWYIGKGAIWDDDNDLVVVNWQAPIAAPFYTATPSDPEGLDARRVYRCRGNQIRDIEELVFHDLAEAIAEGRAPGPVLSDALLESLGRDRSGELADIVSTVQAAQYDVISRDIDQLLVVQGGPGTGKTVVGLHRVSWLLFNRRDQLEANDVLIVGPNPAFVRYISSVLPSLGDEAVVQVPLSALGPRVRVGRVDPPAVRRLKGDRRLVRLLQRGLRNRERVTVDDVELRVDGRRVRLNGRRIATRARQLLGRPHNEAYRELRAFVIDEVRAVLTRSGVRDTAAFAVTARGDSAREIDNYLERVWPNLTPQAFLVALLSTRQQLVTAALGTLSDAEIEMLALPPDTRVGTWQWSADDIPLLDTADALLNGPPATYDHIVVDEAQDLSPLQLESVRRRSRTGSMTVLGDLAQATSPWAHESWDDVVDQLRRDRVPAETVELELGYRLPAEVHEVAMRLLPEVAPTLRSPTAVRRSGHPVVVAPAGADELVAATVATIRELLGTGLIGVVTPASVRPALGTGLDADGLAWSPELRAATAPIVVLTAHEAKGLEFDNVVVVEPAKIVAESHYGLASLFVALTRCTSRLAIVHIEPLPAVLGLGPEPAAPVAGEADDQGDDDPDDDDPGYDDPGYDDPRYDDPGRRRAEVDLRVEPGAELVIDYAEDPPDTSDDLPDRESLADSTLADSALADSALADSAVADGGVADGGVADGVADGGVADGGVADSAPAGDAMDAADAVDATDAMRAMDDGVAADSAPAEPVVGAAGRDVVGTGPVDAIGDFDREIAGAIAVTVADAVLRSTTPVTLPLVAAELARLLAEGGTRARPEDRE